MILRERLSDNYDPPAPWIIEFEHTSKFIIGHAKYSAWLDENVTDADYCVKGRKLGFQSNHDATMFYLAFS